MKQKFFSILMIILLLIGTVLSTGASTSAVTVKTEYGKTLKNYSSSQDITIALEKALLYTSNNASPSNFLTIDIKKGTYCVKTTLHLSSYTTINLGSSKLINGNKERGNIFKSPEDKDYPKYSSLRECVIKNGVLDGNYNHNKSCIMRLCHSQNVIIDNITFLNNYYSHHCELAASNNIIFRNCIFKGQMSDLAVNSSEAIQIDILDKVHFYGFTSYDYTMNDGITIDSCLFKNVYRGVGTHNYFKNLYQKNIHIQNCVFENVTDCAISSVNYMDYEYKNNEYINCKYSVFSRNNGK